MNSPRLDAYGDPLPPFALARLGTIRWRHRGMSISDLVFSRDGRTVFTVGSGVTAIDAATGAVCWVAPPVGATKLALLPTPGGDRLATISSGGIVRLHDAATGTMLRESMLPTHSFNAVAASPDGTTVFVGGAPPFCALLEPDGSPRVTLPISSGLWMSSATFSPDGEALVTTDPYDHVALWSAADGRCLRTFGPEGLSPHSASFTPDGQRLVVVTGRGTLVVFDVLTGDTVSTWQAHPTAAWRVVVTADGLRAVTTDTAGEVCLWRLSDGARLATRRTSGRGAGLALSPDGATVAHADGPRVALVDLTTFAERAPSDEHSGPPEELVFARDDASVATVRGPGEVRWWSLADGRLLASEALDVSVHRLRPLPETDRYAVMPPRHDGAVVIDMASRSLSNDAGIADSQHRWTGRAAGATLSGGKLTLTNAQGASRTFKARPDQLAITPDDRYAVGLDRGRVTVWDLEGLAAAATAKGSSALGLVLSPRGDEVVVRTRTGLQRLGVPDGLVRAVWKAPAGVRVTSVTYSPDGRRMAAVTLDGEVRIVDVAGNAEVACLEGHGAPVVSALFDRDGARVVTWSWDTTALVWSVAEAMADHGKAATPKAAKGGKKRAKS